MCEHGIFGMILFTLSVIFLQIKIFFINSLTVIAGAITGLLLVFFYFVVMIFVTTI